MEIFGFFKLQSCLLVILLFIGYLFIKDGNRLNRKTKKIYCHREFDVLFILGELAILFDGITAVTVNYLNTVPDVVNMLLHLVFLLVYQTFIFSHFYYWITVTDFKPKKIWQKVLVVLPLICSSLIVIINIPNIEYKLGNLTNYSMGICAYATYGVILIYTISALAVLILRRNYISRNKVIACAMSIGVLLFVIALQAVLKEVLVSSLGVILVIISIYLCTENPSLKFLEFYHEEMIIGFSDLVEKKDNSTGSHIHRSSAYAEVITNALRKNAKYKKIVTKDYITNIKKAAPMHDIGKIGIPDSILQKPGKLTAEEFEEMKQHTVLGGKIIKDTFGHLDDERYENMAYHIALCHHEKWNGKGYPEGLKEEEIPLCARIMAVADVFDAISTKRCYHDAMPANECFEIIQSGKGTDFDPDIVEAFFSAKSRIEEILFKNFQ